MYRNVPTYFSEIADKFCPFTKKRKKNIKAIYDILILFLRYFLFLPFICNSSVFVLLSHAIDICQYLNSFITLYVALFQ